MNKGPDAYRTIGEASKEVGVEPYVLRFWETKFSQLRPVKRSGGRRFYRPTDIDKLKLIKSLLYDNGLTIKGAVEQLKKIDINETLNNMVTGLIALLKNQEPVFVHQPLEDWQKINN